jgi:hypothetical protein
LFIFVPQAVEVVFENEVMGKTDNLAPEELTEPHVFDATDLYKYESIAKVGLITCNVVEVTPE